MPKEMTPEERRRFEITAPSLFRETDQEKVANFLAKTRALDISMTGTTDYLTALRQVDASEKFINEEKTKIAKWNKFKQRIKF